MLVLPILSNRYQQKINFRARSPKDICVLCGGHCCNHAALMSAELKMFTDKALVSSRTTENALLAKILKFPILKWTIKPGNSLCEVLNEQANVCIAEILKETNPLKIKRLGELLSIINQKLNSITQKLELFMPITNSSLLDKTFDEVSANEINICPFKDHGKTNLCTIYNGIVYEGRKIFRPNACSIVGSELTPCPWHNPEKYYAICISTKKSLEHYLRQNLNIATEIPMDEVKRYIANQYNLNQVFKTEIWEPYLKTLLE